MKMRKRIKKGSTWFLALTVFMSAMVISDVNAANGIEIDKKCSITFELSGDLDKEFSELKDLEVPVKLYQVADVTVSGTYNSLEEYKGLDLEKVNSDTTAAQWEEMAKKAQEIVAEAEKEPTAEIVIEKGKGVAENLKTGMYLVAAEEVLSTGYAYQFTPFLISLPNNYYATSGNDDWVYDVTTSLKPEKESRLGSLMIDKTLKSFNATLGNATFVFQIEAELDGEHVYSDMVSMVFDAAGTKSLTVSGIPAGAQVTVTEVYSGASYDLITAASQNVTIVADSEEEPGANAVHAAFTNTYNGGMNGNASVVNHFTVNDEGIWDVEQQFGDTETQE